MSDITDSANNNKLVSSKKIQTNKNKGTITRTDSRAHRADQAGFLYPTNQEVSSVIERVFIL